MDSKPARIYGYYTSPWAAEPAFDPGLTDTQAFARARDLLALLEEQKAKQ